MLSFNEMEIKGLKSYVYALADPREAERVLRERIFYIGKGKGNRCFNHAKDERGKEDGPLREGEHKRAKIREIISSGHDVEVLVVRHGMDDAEAQALEAVLIPLLGDTNKVAGHHDQELWLSHNQVSERYNKPVERGDEDLFCGNLLVVSLNQQNVSQLMKAGNEKELKNATLGNWNLNAKDSGRVDCLIGVKNGLIVSIFKTEKLPDGSTRFDRIARKAKGKHGRSRFYGEQQPKLESKFRDRSLHAEGEILSKLGPSAGCQFIPAKV